MPEPVKTGSTYWPRKRFDDLHERSLRDPEGFWAEEAARLEWSKPWDRVLEWNPPFARWFVGGELNASSLCLDRHVRTPRKSKVAIYWEGEPGDTRVLSYADLHREVNRLASVLRGLGVEKGDRVVIYLPMIPELPAFMLACARLGAIHSVVFSGFSAQALGDRLEELQPKVLVTSDGGYRRGHVLALKEIADRAMDLSPVVEHCVLVRRTGAEVAMTPGRDLWLHDLLKGASDHVPPVPVEANHPLYILYTSGTTGKPKGIVHGTGGHMVFTHSTFQWVFDTREDSVYWSTADIGWVAGHTCVVYGPLSHGATIVMYEGAPDYPRIDRWWEIVEKYRVTTLYTSPTAIRMFMARGEEGPRGHDLSSLELLGTVGEPINPEAWLWYYRVIGGERCPIVDTWWQTETGSMMISGSPGIQPMPLKPGSAGPALPGVDVDLLTEEGAPVPPGEKGMVVVRQPWPGMLLTIYHNPERYQHAYWDRYPGVFTTGDYATRDEDGYVWFLGRADEVLKVAGHRIGTAEVESAAVSHPAVAETAVVGREDPIKGVVVVMFAILMDGYSPSEALAQKLRKHVRRTIGPVATPESILFVSSLPKTRSGKIMRRVLASVASGKEVGDVTTLEEEASVDEVQRAYAEIRGQLAPGR